MMQDDMIRKDANGNFYIPLGYSGDTDWTLSWGKGINRLFGTAADILAAYLDTGLTPEQVARMQTDARRIPVEERKPPEKQMVIGYTDRDGVFAGMIIGGTWYSADMFTDDAMQREVGVTHWRPLR